MQIYKTIGEAVKFPFKKWGRLFNFWWMIIIPIFGWLPLYGYLREIISNLLNGKDKEIPKFNNYWDKFKSGFLLLVYSLVVGLIFFGISYILFLIPFIGVVLYIVLLIYYILVVPMLLMNYIRTNEFEQGFNFSLVHDVVFKNLGDYIVMMLKTILLAIIFFAFSIPIITLLVTIPALMFAQYYFYADFYKVNLKYKKSK